MPAGQFAWTVRGTRTSQDKTNSPDFPTTATALQKTHGGAEDKASVWGCVLLKLNAAGDKLHLLLVPGWQPGRCRGGAGDRLCRERIHHRRGSLP